MKYSKVIIFALIFFFIIPFGFAQKRTLKKADEAYQTGEYHLAFELFEKVYEKIPSKDEKAVVAFKMGECSRIMLNDKNARKWYRKAVRYNVNNPMAYLYYADALKMDEEYEDNCRSNDLPGASGQRCAGRRSSQCVVHRCGRFAT